MSTIKIQINDKEVAKYDPEKDKLGFEMVIQEAKEQEKKGLWRPEFDEIYYFIDEIGSEDSWTTNMNNVSDKEKFKFGNCFRTKEELLSELGRRKALTRIKDYIAREGIEREKDWFDGDTFYSLIRSWGFSVEDTEKIIKACESDLKILFGI